MDRAVAPTKQGRLIGPGYIALALALMTLGIVVTRVTDNLWAGLTPSIVGYPIVLLMIHVRHRRRSSHSSWARLAAPLLAVGAVAAAVWVTWSIRSPIEDDGCGVGDGRVRAELKVGETWYMGFGLPLARTDGVRIEDAQVSLLGGVDTRILAYDPGTADHPTLRTCCLSIAGGVWKKGREGGAVEPFLVPVHRVRLKRRDVAVRTYGDAFYQWVLVLEVTARFLGDFPMDGVDVSFASGARRARCRLSGQFATFSVKPATA